MHDVRIKCLCLKCVEIDLEKCSKHHTFARIITLATQINNHHLVVPTTRRTVHFYDAICAIQFD